MITRNLQFFALALIASVSLVWGANAFSSGLTDFTFAHQLKTNPEILAAYASQQEIRDQLFLQEPWRTKNYAGLEIAGKSAISVYLNQESGHTKTLFQKNSDTPLLIASLTKLMTALTALTHYEPNLPVSLTQEALATEGKAGHLQINDALTIKDLLYLALIESSNDAAVALTIPSGTQEFVGLMNADARALGLTSTTFINPTGLDTRNTGNYSTSAELSEIALHIIQQEPQIFDILSLQKLDLYDRNGEFHHTMVNTNDLLEYTEWPAKILGGKTGWTPRAGSSLILVLQSPDQTGYIVNVLLGSEDRFGEMKSMLRWVLEAYQWE